MILSCAKEKEEKELMLKASCYCENNW